MKTLYTIGYTGFKLDDFVKVLKKYNISCIIDVRSNPVSKFYPDYNFDRIKIFLKKNNILYRNYSEGFGARQNDIKYYTNGILDFDVFTKSERFIKDYEKIEKGISMGYRFALMCAEKNPFDCHRAIMISRIFYNSGYDIRHILPSGNYETQKDIEMQLLDCYFPNRQQTSFFSLEQSDTVLIQKAYKMKNADIGYHLKEETDFE